MNPTIFFSVCSLFYLSFLIILLFSKHNNKDKVKHLKILSVINLGSLLCESGGIFLGSNYKSFELLNGIVLRLMLVLYVVWFSVFIMFTFAISSGFDKKINKKKSIIYILMIISIFLVCFLKINYMFNSKGVIIYSYGPAVDALKMYTILCELICLIIMFSNIKKIKTANYSSLFVLISITTLSAVVQTQFPSILLVASTETFVMYIAYISLLKEKAHNLTFDKKKESE